ncbi:unnamed protein product [Brachionus calyciflorus]|uniref:Uncharacterized protein n=1 Tax=Brachionus calyciflorus TaxID=104777 RepID=A0A813Z5V6_9BILA|nr:unnamed protein product [Brachionus calyciflorus]
MIESYELIKRLEQGCISSNSYLDIKVKRHDRLYLKLCQRLIQFLKSNRSFLMIVHGPSKSGKKTLVYNLLDSAQIDNNLDYLTIKTYNYTTLKNALIKSKPSLIIIENIPQLLKNINKLKLLDLFRLARQYRKKLILILKKNYFTRIKPRLNGLKITYFHINYLNLNEIKCNFDQTKFNCVNLNGNLIDLTQLKNYYELLKKPYILKRTLNYAEKSLIKETSNQVVKYLPIYSLSSVIYSTGVYSLLIQANNNTINLESVIVKLNDQFRIIGLNQFMSDVTNEKKSNSLKSGYYLIKVNKYDSELTCYLMDKINQLYMKCIFLINDMSLFEKYKYLFKFKFKIEIMEANDVYMEEVFSDCNVPPCDYVKNELGSLEDCIGRIRNYALIESKEKILNIRQFNVFRIDLNEQKSIITNEKMTNLFMNYLIRTKKLVILIENLHNDDLSLVETLINKKIKFLVHISPDYKYKKLLCNVLGHKFLYLKSHETELGINLNQELIEILKKSPKLETLNATNVFLTYYFDLKRIESISFNQYFNIDQTIELNDKLDTSIRSINNLIISHDSGIKFIDNVYEKYFTAMFIIKELQTDKDNNYNLIKSTILKYRYYKKYQELWSFIAECISNESSYFKSLSLNQEKSLLNYWKIILSNQNKDLVGVYHNTFLEQCLNKSNLNNKFFNVKKLRRSLSQNLSSCNLNHHDTDDIFYQFRSFNDGLNETLNFLKLNSHDKKPINVQKFNQMLLGLMAISNKYEIRLVNLIDFLTENKSDHILLSSQIIEENFIFILEEINRKNMNLSVRIKEMLFKLLKKNHLRTKMLSIKALVNLKIGLNEPMFDTLIYIYNHKLDLWEHVLTLIKNSSLTINIIEKIFNLIKTSKDLNLIECLFKLLGNSIKFKFEILNYHVEIDLNLLDLYYDLHFNLNSFIYMDKLINLTMCKSSNLIFNLHKYTRNKLVINVDLIYTHENLAEKLEYLIENNFLTLHEVLKKSLFDNLKIYDIKKIVLLILKYGEIETYSKDIIDYLHNEVGNEDNQNKLTSHVIPCLWLLINNGIHSQFIMDLIKIIIKKVIQNKFDFKPVNNLLVLMVKLVGKDGDLNMENYLDLVQFYYNQFQQYQKCFIKKKNLDKFNQNNSEMTTTISRIFDYMDTSDLLEILFKKYKETRNNDCLRFVVKKCVASKLSVQMEENEFCVIDYDVVFSQIVDDGKLFQGEFNKLVIEETKHLQMSKLIILNDQSLHRIKS